MAEEDTEITVEEKDETTGEWEDISKELENIAKLKRAFEGKPPDPQDIITRLTNVKNILERSRFPTYPLLSKQIYLRLIGKYIPEASACLEWAEREAEALISYKGLSREEFTEQMKHIAGAREDQQFFIGDMVSGRTPGRFARFRKPKKREAPSEFAEE